MKETKWLGQYLRNEDMFYIVEMHPEDGVEGEYFFDTKEEVDKFIIENNINLKMI
jgi:hypothetical protein